MTDFWRHASAALLLLLLLPAPSLAEGETAPARPEEPQAAAPAEPPAAPIAEDALSTTHHVVEVQEGELAYTATAGTLPLGQEPDEPRGRVFFVAYEAEGSGDAERPLTFVFNGGPGASSAYLHLGALGPRRILLNDDGTLPPPPARLADNPLTWLSFTDLVFIDPVGTGYSRDVPRKETEGKDADESETRFWGARQDTEALSEFIRLYLTRNNRWQAPKYLVGESYGGFRAAALSDLLPSRFGIGLNGVVLISPVLEYSYLASDEFRLLPWVLPLPSYAATARHHGKGVADGTAPASPRAVLPEVEAFSLGDMLLGLAQGAALPAARRDELYARLARFTGLPLDLIRRNNGRIPRQLFVKALLRGSHRLVSIYDGSLTSIDPDPGDPSFKGRDPTLAALNTLLASAFNSYVREELKFETDAPYRILNHEVGRRWDWESALGGGQGFAGTADDLEAGMALNPALQVLIVHGCYDLVTPYFGSVFAIEQMALDAALRPNLTLAVYEAGHMVYTHAPARAALYRDAEAFYRRVAE